MTSSGSGLRLRNEGSRTAGLLFSALIWAALSIPIVIRGIPELLDRGVALWWLALLFPAGGLLLVVKASVEGARWLRWRRPELVLEAPARTGAELESRIEFGLDRASAGELRLHLSLIGGDFQGRSDGRAKWRDEVLWTGRGAPRVEPSPRGARLHFTLPIPADLPATRRGEAAEEAGRRHLWRLRITGPVPGLDPDFRVELPVEEGVGGPAADDLAPDVSGGTEDRLLPARTLTVRPFPDGVEFHAPWDRSTGSGLTFALVGLAFVFFPALVAAVAWNEAGTDDWFSGFVLLFIGFVVAVFGLLGLLMAGAGLWNLTNSLTVRLRGDRVQTVRRWLGVTVHRRAFSLDRVAEIEVGMEGSIRHGEETQGIYDLRAFLDDGTVATLADGLEGLEVAEAAARLFERETGIDVVRRARSERRSSVGWRKERRH